MQKEKNTCSEMQACKGIYTDTAHVHSSVHILRQCMWERGEGLMRKEIELFGAYNLKMMHTCMLELKFSR